MDDSGRLFVEGGEDGMSTSGMEEKKRRQEIRAEKERSRLTANAKTSATKKQSSQGENDQKDGKMSEGWKRTERETTSCWK